MADELSKRGSADRLRVNTNEPHDARYWCQKWGCTEEELRKAVQVAGVMADKVAAQLDKYKSES
ncbi:MAG: hypothetical protein JWR21_44 [Herminiimonas sp.]|nr:hypothetical protein [Herminiimonas sp.]